MSTFFAKNTRLGALLVNLIAGMLGAFTMIAHQAWADWDGDPATEAVPRVVPYRGVLEFDGEPVDGDMDMRFALFDQPTGGDMSGDTCAAPCRWRSAYLNTNNQAVRVYNGQFTVNLGEHDPIDQALYEAGGLWLGIEVKETALADEDANWVTLANRQRITPVPYALWSRQTSDLDVKGSLVVDQGASIEGGASVTGDLDVSGNVEGNELRVATGRIRAADADMVLSSTEDDGGVLVDAPLTIGTTVEHNLHITHRASQIVLGSDGALGPHGVRFPDNNGSPGFQFVHRTGPNALMVENRSDGESGDELLRIDDANGVTVGSDLNVTGTIRSINDDFSGLAYWQSDTRGFDLSGVGYAEVRVLPSEGKRLMCSLQAFAPLGGVANYDCVFRHDPNPENGVLLYGFGTIRCFIGCVEF